MFSIQEIYKAILHAFLMTKCVMKHVLKKHVYLTWSMWDTRVWAKDGWTNEWMRHVEYLVASSGMDWAEMEYKFISML